MIDNTEALRILGLIKKQRRLQRRIVRKFGEADRSLAHQATLAYEQMHDRNAQPEQVTASAAALEVEIVKAKERLNNH